MQKRAPRRCGKSFALLRSRLIVNPAKPISHFPQSYFLLYFLETSIQIPRVFTIFTVNSTDRQYMYRNTVKIYPCAECNRGQSNSFAYRSFKPNTSFIFPDMSQPDLIISLRKRTTARLTSHTLLGRYILSGII